MLVSHKHKFVFVHIYKTAGTSVAKALTPFTVSSTTRRTVRVLRKLRLPSPKKWDPGLSVNHKTAVETREQLGREVFDNYFSFSFVRNPWAWQVSVYNYVLRTKRHRQHEQFQSLGSFERYIRWLCDPGVSERDDRCQTDFVCDEAGNQLVDFVGRFENLQADFGAVCQRLGICVSLPMLNVDQPDRDYRLSYDSVTQELIALKYAKDIDRFGYQFESSKAKVA